MSTHGFDIDESWEDDYDPDDFADESNAWLCSCGHYEESGLHCSQCASQPPWGCDCSACNEPDDEDDQYPEEWMYPGA